MYHGYRHDFKECRGLSRQTFSWLGWQPILCLRMTHRRSTINYCSIFRDWRAYKNRRVWSDLLFQVLSKKSNIIVFIRAKWSLTLHLDPKSAHTRTSLAKIWIIKIVKTISSLLKTRCKRAYYKRDSIVRHNFSLTFLYALRAQTSQASWSQAQ